MTATRAVLLETARDRDRPGVEAMASRDPRGPLRVPFGVSRTRHRTGRRPRPVREPRRVIARVSRPVGEARRPTVSGDHGFSMDEAEVVNWSPRPTCSTLRSF
jgi:Fur family ferric uptake transcriptional regulator